MTKTFEGRITASHVYALGEGAVITTPLLLTQEEFENFTLHHGDEIDVQDPGHNMSVTCRIMDIESVNALPDHVLVRLTLEKA